MFVDHIEIAVREREPDVDFGIVGQKFDDDRQYVQPPEQDRRRQRQFAARRPKLAGRAALGLLDFGENAPRREPIGFAGFGQREPARRAYE